MSTVSASNLGLVPQRRLGVLLADLRNAYGYDLADMARRSMGRFSEAQLGAIESGETTLGDADIEALSLLYEFNSTPVRAQRSKLILAEDEFPSMTGEFTDDVVLSVLQRYVGLLYLLRNQPVGETLALRSDDVDMLAGAFHLPEAAVGDELLRIMAEDTGVVSENCERMRRRLVVPAAGLLVGPTPSGMLVLVK